MQDNIVVAFTNNSLKKLRTSRRIILFPTLYIKLRKDFFFLRIVSFNSHGQTASQWHALNAFSPAARLQEF
jgi:hypothetical protein